MLTGDAALTPGDGADNAGAVLLLQQLSQALEQLQQLAGRLHIGDLQVRSSTRVFV